jgi:hypothetical protein
LNRTFAFKPARGKNSGAQNLSFRRFLNFHFEEVQASICAM